METSQNLDIVREKAEGYAAQCKHEQIAPSHYLLAILQTAECNAYKMLEGAKAPLPKIIELIVGKRFNQECSGTPTNIPNAEAKACITQASDIAMQCGGHSLRTEHLLIGLLTDATLCKEVFAPLRINTNKLLQRIISEVGAQSVPEGAGNFRRPNLDFLEVCYSLNDLAKKGKLDNVIGRKSEIARATQILARRRKNNPVFVGAAGVGKTAIAEGLAISIVQKTAPACLLNKTIFVFDVTGLISNTVFRGQLEGKIKSILDHVKANPDFILFIDEIHLIVGAGNSVGGMDVANMLKSALSRGEARIIGATTEDEYNKIIAKDAALERRFQPIFVDEPSDEDTIAILNGSVCNYETHHNVKYSPESIVASVHLSKRYLPNRKLPDKAIDILDEAGSALKLAPSNDLAELDKKIESITQQKIVAANEDRFTDAKLLWTAIRTLKAQREKALQNSNVPKVVTEDHIRKAISTMSKIPVERLSNHSRKDIVNQTGRLASRIIGQQSAIETVAKYCRRSKTSFNDPNKPIGSFLLLGPTGVGKTLLAKSLAIDLSGDETSLIQLDMSEYMEKFSVSRLIGSPPGYVGYDDQNSLVERVRRNPYCVILLDEIEKAHPEVWNMLLQVLEEGKLTDGQGRIANFCNTIILMTSNLGYATMAKSSMGFKSEQEDTKALILTEVKKSFRPEKKSW